MPVEIRELYIKVEVASEDGNKASQNGRQTKQPDQQEIVDQCVEQVMELLEQSKER